ncbi:PREDICTED: KRR1 small subunit processome component homolog [Fragaria vesca subsp. vesca]
MEISAGHKSEELCPNSDHMELEKSGDTIEVTSFTESFSRFHIPKLTNAWPEVEAALQEHGISYKLNLAELYMTVSTTPITKDPGIIHRAREVIVLLSKTTVPTYVVIDILNGDMVHDHIKTGYQEDGLAAIHGIKRERFVKRQTRFLECLKDFSRLLNVGLYVNGNTVTAAGTSLEQVKVIRRIVERCYVENVSPAAIVSRLNMRLDINNAERQLRALLM